MSIVHENISPTGLPQFEQSGWLVGEGLNLAGDQTQQPYLDLDDVMGEVFSAGDPFPGSEGHAWNPAEDPVLVQQVLTNLEHVRVAGGAGPFSISAVILLMERIRTAVQDGQVPDIAWLNDAQQILAHRQEPFAPARLAESLRLPDVSYDYRDTEAPCTFLDGFPRSSTEDRSTLQRLIITEEDPTRVPTPRQVAEAQMNYLQIRDRTDPKTVAILLAHMSLLNIPVPE